MSRFNSSFGGQLAQTYAAPPPRPEDQQVGPLSTAYAATLNKQRLNGSVTNPMTMNGAAGGSPFNAAITLAKPVQAPVQTPTQAQMMFESPEQTSQRQAAMMFESPGAASQRQAAEMFANAQPVQQVANPDPGEAQPAAPNRHVEVIRGGVKSGFDWNADGTQGVETLTDGTVVPADYAGRAALYGYDPNPGAGGGNPSLDRGGRGWIGQYTHDKLPGVVDAFAPNAPTGSPFAQARARRASAAAPKAVPPATLESALAGLPPETISQLHAFKSAGATDEQVIAKAISLSNRAKPAAAKAPTFSAGTQQDRWVIEQSRRRLRELDAKTKVKSPWEEPPKLSAQEQQEYDGLKTEIAARSKAVADFDGSGEQATGRDGTAGGGGKLTHDEALAFVKQAGGDKAKARELARAAGRSF